MGVWPFSGSICPAQAKADVLNNNANIRPKDIVNFTNIFVRLDYKPQLSRN